MASKGLGGRFAFERVAAGITSSTRKSPPARASHSCYQTLDGSPENSTSKNSTANSDFASWLETAEAIVRLLLRRGRAARRAARLNPFQLVTFLGFGLLCQQGADLDFKLLFYFISCRLSTPVALTELDRPLC